MAVATASVAVFGWLAGARMIVRLCGRMRVEMIVRPTVVVVVRITVDMPVRSRLRAA